jgi:hypothetical protein
LYTTTYWKGENIMVSIYNKNTGDFLGLISDDQLQFLVNQLEEEGIDDQDYAITPMLLAFFEGQGADPDLLALLRKGLGEQEEINIRWEA